MKNKLEQLPIEVLARIKVRNTYSDELTDPTDALEKADFLLEMIQSEHTGYLQTKESEERWRADRSRVCLLIDIARDYTMAAHMGLLRMNERIGANNSADRAGGGGIDDA